MITLTVPGKNLVLKKKGNIGCLNIVNKKVCLLIHREEFALAITVKSATAY
jgi:hypothetical protein